MPYRSEVVRPRPALLPAMGCGAPRRDVRDCGGPWAWPVGSAQRSLSPPNPSSPISRACSGSGDLERSATRLSEAQTRNSVPERSGIPSTPGTRLPARGRLIYPPHTPPSSPPPTTACTHFLRLPWRLFPALARIGYTWLRAALGQRGGQGPRGRWVDLPELESNIGVAPGSAPSCVGNFLQAEQPVSLFSLRINEFTEFLEMPFSVCCYIHMCFLLKFIDTFSSYIEIPLMNSWINQPLLSHSYIT